MMAREQFLQTSQVCPRINRDSVPGTINHNTLPDHCVSTAGPTFLQACTRVLKPGGLLLANLFNNNPGSHARLRLAHYAVHVSPTVLSQAADTCCCLPAQVSTASNAAFFLLTTIAVAVSQLQDIVGPGNVYSVKAVNQEVSPYLHTSPTAKGSHSPEHIDRTLGCCYR